MQCLILKENEDKSCFLRKFPVEDILCNTVITYFVRKRKITRAFDKQVHQMDQLSYRVNFKLSKSGVFFLFFVFFKTI